MGLKVYKAEDFDTLVHDLETNYGRERLHSIKLDNYKSPDGKVIFWYAVVITEDVTPYQAPSHTSDKQHFNLNEVWCVKWDEE